MKRDIINKLTKKRYIGINVSAEEFIALFNAILEDLIRRKRNSIEVLLVSNNVINFGLTILDFDGNIFVNSKTFELLRELRAEFNKTFKSELADIEKIIIMENLYESIEFLYWEIIPGVIDDYFDFIGEVYYYEDSYCLQIITPIYFNKSFIDVLVYNYYDKNIFYFYYVLFYLMLLSFLL